MRQPESARASRFNACNRLKNPRIPFADEKTSQPNSSSLCNSSSSAGNFGGNSMRINGHRIASAPRDDSSSDKRVHKAGVPVTTTFNPKRGGRTSSGGSDGVEATFPITITMGACICIFSTRSAMSSKHPRHSRCCGVVARSMHRIASLELRPASIKPRQMVASSRRPIRTMSVSTPARSLKSIADDPEFTQSRPVTTVNDLEMPRCVT